MMELKYEFLWKQDCKDALNKLFESDFDGKTAYNIRRIHYICEKEHKKLQKEFQGIAKKYAVLTENGDIKPPLDIKPEHKEVYDKEANELMLKTFPLERCEKVHVAHLTNSTNLKLSSFDYQALEPILDGLDL